MKREISMKDAIGKVLTGFIPSHISSQAILTLQDETFTTIYSNGDDIEEASLSPDDFGDSRLIEAGIVTPEELEARDRLRKLEYERLTEARERALLVKLKSKYHE